MPPQSSTLFFSPPGRSPQVKDGAGHRGDRAGGDQLVRHRGEADVEDDGDDGDDDDDDDDDDGDDDDDDYFVFVDG